ncbi:hypothetical protein AgCh_005307 [Apium graveolens]
MSLGNIKRGQPSSIKSPKASVIFQPKRNYPKNSDKNPLDQYYETPRPDEKKLFTSGWTSTFSKAKKEEKVRLKQQQKQAALEAKNLAKKPANTEVTLPDLTTENLDEGKKEEPKQTKRKFRYKIYAKRKIDFNEDKKDYILPLPDLNLPIFSKQRKTKERVVKTVKPAKLQSKQVAKPNPNADIDNSGTIDYGEFLAVTLHINKIEREENLVRAFAFFDKDGSGYITFDELQ